MSRPLGSVSDARAAEDPAVKVLNRVDRVVLIETSYGTAVQVRHTPELVVHIFEHEPEARRAFELFEH